GAGSETAALDPCGERFRRAPTDGRRVHVEELDDLEDGGAVDVVGLAECTFQIVADHGGQEAARLDAMLDVPLDAATDMRRDQIPIRVLQVFAHYSSPFVQLYVASATLRRSQRPQIVMAQGSCRA